MKIGILQTGRAPDQLQEQFGDYNTFFVRLLDGKGFEFVTYAALDGDLPLSPNDAEGWLITGSKFGAYEDHAWIPPLEDFIRAVYVAKLPMIGICFGHQIIAQALGGKVEKFEGGWSVGPVSYEMADGKQMRLIAWHQDQVVTPPPEATVVGSTDFCRYASLRYGDTVLTIQPHPEFTNEFASALLEARGAVLPDNIKAQADRDIGLPLDTDPYAEIMTTFFCQKPQK